MNTKKWTEKLFDNLGPKIVCLGIAILLYVFNRVSSLERKTITVPLKVEASGLMMPYSDIPRYVRIYVRSTAENISSINSSSFTASLNLDNYTEAGHYAVPINVTTSQGLLLFNTLEYSCHPEVINVELDEKIVRYVPVQPVYSGEVAHGYEISNVDIAPSTVKIVGPSMILNKVKHVYTRKVNVNGASTSLSQEVKLDNITPKLDVLPENDFKVTVAITPSKGEKDFENIRPSYYGLSDTLVLVGEIPAVSIKVGGVVPVLESYELDEKSVSVDLSSIFDPGIYEVPVKVVTPINIELVEKSKETVSITVETKVVEAEEQEQPEDENDVPVEETSDDAEKEVSE